MTLIRSFDIEDLYDLFICVASFFANYLHLLLYAGALRCRIAIEYRDMYFGISLHHYFSTRSVQIIRHTFMKLQPTMYHLCGMALAYGLVLFIPMNVDFTYETNVELLVIGWLNIGLIVMVRKRIQFPTPDRQRIDVIGALKTLWWAFFWPNYLINK